MVVCDNCPLNQGVYKLFGGPGKVQISDFILFFIYDYPRVFKTIRNNWFTKMLRELKFCIDGKEYLAQWNDLVKLYEEDKNDPIRLTKLTYNAIYPKPL